MQPAKSSKQIQAHLKKSLQYKKCLKTIQATLTKNFEKVV